MPTVLILEGKAAAGSKPLEGWLPDRSFSKVGSWSKQIITRLRNRGILAHDDDNCAMGGPGVDSDLPLNKKYEPLPQFIFSHMCRNPRINVNEPPSRSHIRSFPRSPARVKQALTSLWSLLRFHTLSSSNVVQ